MIWTVRNVKVCESNLQKRVSPQDQYFDLSNNLKCIKPEDYRHTTSSCPLIKKKILE